MSVKCAQKNDTGVVYEMRKLEMKGRKKDKNKIKSLS